MAYKEKYSVDIKEQVVKDYLDGKSYGELIEKYNLPVSCGKNYILNWTKSYKDKGRDGLTNISSVPRYSYETKLQAVNDYLSNKGTYYEIAKKYNIANPNVILEWIKKYSKNEKFMVFGTVDTYRNIKARPTVFEERLQIVKYCILRQKRYIDAAELFDVSFHQVLNWTEQFLLIGEEALVDFKYENKDRYSEYYFLYELAQNNKGKKAEELRLEIVEKYVGGTTLSELAKEYNIADCFLHIVVNWAKIYKKYGNAGFNIRPKKKEYSQDFKNQVVQDYLSSKESFNEIAKKYAIPSVRTAWNWVKEYEKQSNEKLEKPKEKFNESKWELEKKEKNKDDYSQELKLEVIEKYLDGIPTTVLINEYGQDVVYNLKNWLKKYKVSGISAFDYPSDDEYDISFKENAIKEYLNNDLSFEQIAKKYGIKSPNLVHKWLKEYANYDGELGQLNLGLYEDYLKHKEDLLNRKNEIAIDSIKNNCAHYQTAKKYGIKVYTVARYVKKYIADNPNAEVVKNYFASIENEKNQKIEIAKFCIDNNFSYSLAGRKFGVSPEMAIYYTKKYLTETNQLNLLQKNKTDRLSKEKEIFEYYTNNKVKYKDVAEKFNVKPETVRNIVRKYKNKK